MRSVYYAFIILQLLADLEPLTAEEIAVLMPLSVDDVKAVLRDLKAMGMVVETNGKYRRN